MFGALSVLVMQCPTVEKGLEMFGRYLHYSVEAVLLDFRTEGDLVYFVIDTPFDIAAQSDQFWDHAVALALDLLTVLCGEAWAPRSINMRRSQPSEPGNYSRHFRCPVAFGSEATELVFERAVLQRPISGSINTIPRQLQAYLRTSFEGNFLEQMRRVIISLLPADDCNAKTVAQCMGYSLRTLQRKLRGEQTGFQQQIDRVRSELAISYLQEPQFNLTDIGALLGFAELSVFTRSFKRWFGVTPSQWRKRKFA